MALPASTPRALKAAAVFAAGVVIGTGAHILATASAATVRFQNAHIWVAHLNPDGGMPSYGGQRCSYTWDKADAGQRDDCGDLGELKDEQATAFEAFLKSLGIAAPR